MKITAKLLGGPADGKIVMVSDGVPYYEVGEVNGKLRMCVGNEGENKPVSDISVKKVLYKKSAFSNDVYIVVTPTTDTRSDFEKHPFKGICGKCGSYKEKLNKDCLCESCEFFGVTKASTDALPESILRFVKSRF